MTTVSTEAPRRADAQESEAALSERGVTAIPTAVAPRSSSRYFGRAAWGIVWRYLMLAAAVVAQELRPAIPPLAIVEFFGVLGSGLVIGLWRGRSRFARIWRGVMVAVLVAFVAPALPVAYPVVLVAALGLAVAEGLLAAGRRRPRVGGIA